MKFYVFVGGDIQKELKIYLCRTYKCLIILRPEMNSKVQKRINEKTQMRAIFGFTVCVFIEYFHISFYGIKFEME